MVKTRARQQFFLIFLMVFTLMVNTFSLAYAAPSVKILKEQVDHGIVRVALGAETPGIKVMIQKAEEKYFYDLKTSEDAFPLQLGDGEYRVSVLENTTGIKYKVLKSENIEARFFEEYIVFLGSAQPIKWNDQMTAIKTAKALATGKNQNENVQIIYQYVVNKIKYDENKIKYIPSDYLPEIDLILQSEKGICYDYAALLAAMLRSIGVPTKLVKGYKNDITEYHAWNEVYLDGKWLIVDPTYDAWSKKNGTSYSFEKDKDLYKKAKEY